MNEDIRLPVNIINLKSRTDRKKHILREFEGKREFIPLITDACEHKFGNIGLWNSIKNIIRSQTETSQDFVIICEDDHLFLENYSYAGLLSSLEEARRNKADVLLGGISWFSSAFPVSKSLCWVELFSGTQFLIIFRQFFDCILNADFTASDTADYKICALTQKKFLIYPFISIQHDFGYSDATQKNNQTGRVQTLFAETIERLNILSAVSAFYGSNAIPAGLSDDIDFERITIPTYVIFQKNNKITRKHIQTQFSGRKEFETHLLFDQAGRSSKKGRFSKGIQLAIKDAIKNDDDFIIVCEDNHEFSMDYSKERLISGIIEAYQQSCDLLIGGCEGVDLIVPLTTNRFWTNHYYSSRFVVIFRKLFDTFLNEAVDEDVHVDMKFSEITSNKMLLYPFVSLKKELTVQNKPSSFPPADLPGNDIFSPLQQTNERLLNMQHAFLKYNTCI